MARAALDWSTPDLAKASGLGTATVARFELGKSVAADSVKAMADALTGAGVQFIAGGAYRGGVVPPQG